MATLSPIAPASIEGGLYKSQSVTSLLVPQQQQQQQSMPSPRQDYPQPQLTESMLADLTEESKRTGNWSRLSDLFEQAFSSPKDLVAVFRSAQRDPDPSKGSGLNQAFVEAAYATLKDMPYDMQKKVLKANISVLLEKRHTMGGKGGTSSSKDDVRALFVILQNPLLEKVTTFVLFAHLLRCVAALGDFDHHCLVNWLARLEKASFEALLRRIQYFISVRLFPPKTEDLPPLDKASWWVPNAVKVLALLNAANNQCGSRAKVPYTEFYNHTIDSLDLLAGDILQRDSETQMIIMAKRSLVAGVAKRNQPSMDMLFLNITVRRSHLVADSMRQISAKQKDLKKKLRVTFEGEAGLDMGGLTKEWFLLLIRSVFLSNSGLFTYDAKRSHLVADSMRQISAKQKDLKKKLRTFAFHLSVIASCSVRVLCHRLLAPLSWASGTTPVCPVTLTDLREVMPELAHGLYELLRHQGDVAEDFGATFEIAYTDGAGKNRTVELKPDGRSISVTNANRQEYVAMYCDYLLNKGVYSKFRSFYLGFHQVCASNALILLRPEEVEHLVCGSPKFDFNELRKVTVYDGYRPNDAQVKWFWDIAINMEPAKQAALLLFITGSDRIPVGGMAEMQMKIVRVNRLEMLPIAHTCFNQIMLPTYKTKATLTERLLLAIDNSEGFGLE
uniref:HECT-type E3 ubiquitin transferase n=1 Tax=Macrostomum lignano TaxID=282301 RepID=A0A1I8GS14_9PLAT